MHLALWAVCLAVGIAAAVALTPLAVAVLAAVGGLALIPLVWRRAWVALMAVLALVLGLVLSGRDVSRASAPAAVPEDQWVEVTGQVARGVDVEQGSGELPTETHEGPLGRAWPAARRCHLRIDIDRVDGKSVRGGLSLTILDGVPDVAPGNWVSFSTRLYLPMGFANPGLPDARLLARGQGIDFVATVRGPSELHRIDGWAGPLAYARRCADGLRRAMALAISHRLQQPAAGFVRTMVVGERTDVPATTEDGFRAAGATHVLSVSGLHLAVVVALFFHAAKWCLARRPSWSLWVPAKVMASVLSLPACLFYTLLTGEAVATVRSAVMAAMVLGGTIVNRPVSLVAGIGAAAIGLLIASPLALLDVSFQLSFASVMGLGLFSRWLLPHSPRREESRWWRVRVWLLGSFSASCAASLVTTPLVAHHFGEITPAAPLGNLVLVPIVELLVLPCGLVGALLALAHPWLGALPLQIAGWASQLTLVLAELFRRFAPVVLVRYPTWIETLLLVAAASFVLQAWAGSALRRKRWLLLGLVTVLLAGATMLSRELARLGSEDLRVTFLDVGQGDSVLVEGPGGFAALVDGGGRYDNSFDTGARIVEPVLRSRGITRLDLLVLSHPHPDHMNGLFRILRRFPVGAFWQNGDDGHNPAYHELIRLAGERGVALPAPDAVSRSGMLMEAVSPCSDGRVRAPPGLGANDASLVVRVVYAGRQVLLAGDIGEHGEAELLRNRKPGTRLRSEVVKVLHHGSRYASSDRLIDAMAPALAVVSAGRFNRFGLPSPITVDRYLRRRIEVLRTDRDGAVTVTISPAGRIGATCVRDCSTPVTRD